MPSKTLFLFFLAALVAIFLPPLLISDNPHEVLAALDQTRHIVLSALDHAPSPIIDTLDTLFALYARLCGTLSSGPLAESTYRIHACQYQLHVVHGLHLQRLDNPRYAFMLGFCKGVESGLQLPGADSRIPIHRAPAIFVLLASTLGLLLLPSLITTFATYGYRAVVYFARLFTTLGHAFLASVVPVIKFAPVVIDATLHSVSSRIPAVFEVASLCVAGVTSCALVIATLVSCWGIQMLEAALSRWMRWMGWKSPFDDYSNTRGTQTPDFMPGICSNPASVCKDVLRRFMVVEDVLDDERRRHADQLFRNDKVNRERDAELGRLRQKTAVSGKEISAAKEETAKLGRDLSHARAVIDEQKAKLNSTRDDATAAAERSQWEEEKSRLTVDLNSASQRIATLENELSVEKQSRAEESTRSLEAEQSVEGRIQALRHEALQKIAELQNELSVEKSGRAEECQRSLEAAQAVEGQIQALKDQACQEIDSLRQQLSTEQRNHAEKIFNSSEAALAAEQKGQELKAKTLQIESLEKQLSNEHRSRAEEREKALEEAKARESSLQARLAEFQKVTGVELMQQVVDHCEFYGNLTCGNREEYRKALELRNALDSVIPGQEPEPPSTTVAGAPPGRAIKACKGPSAKLARAGRKEDDEPQGDSSIISEEE